MAHNESVSAASPGIHVAAAFSADRATRGRFHVRAVPARAFPRRKTSVRERGNVNRDSRGAQFFSLYLSSAPLLNGRRLSKRGSLTQEKRTSFPGSISKSSTSDSDVFVLIISLSNFTKIGSSRKIAYLSIDSKSSAIKKGQAILESMRLPHLMLSTSGILRSCMREFIIISSTRAGVTSGLSL